jgi:pimeloyl-ACP methyl ester carboxylesterase
LAIPARGVVFAADGAGDFRACSKALRTAIEAEKLPISVETFCWSHGFGRVISDQIGHRYARHVAEELAERVLEFRQQHPGMEIYLVGHSAGSAVVLSAAGLLPPDSVSRIVLLAPSVPADYDLRPALRTARAGIDVFYSKWDWWYLGLAVTVVGAADGSCLQPAAGRIGFRPRSDLIEDALLCAGLRQYPWDPSQAWSGNLGGHYGVYQQNFLKAYVLPLFQGIGGQKSGASSKAAPGR